MYHVYSNTAKWKPYVGQKIKFKREHNNPKANLQLLKGHDEREDKVSCCWARTNTALSIYLLFYWRRG